PSISCSNWSTSVFQNCDSTRPREAPRASSSPVRHANPLKAGGSAYPAHTKKRRAKGPGIPTEKGGKGMAQTKVLVTGMSGLIGGAVRRRLEGRYELSALNRRDVPDVPCHRADIADLEAILPAFAGIDTVVHLAAFVGGFDKWDEILRHNVIG